MPALAILTLAVLLLLSMTQALSASVSEAIQQQQYQIAKDLLHTKLAQADSAQQRQQYQHQLNKLQLFIDNYERNVIQQGQLLAEQSRWSVAEKVLERGLQRLPESQRLQQAKDALLIQVEQQFNAEQDKLLMQNIAYVAQRRQQLSRLRSLKPEDKQIDDWISHNEAQALQLQQQLDQVKRRPTQLSSEHLSAAAQTLSAQSINAQTLTQPVEFQPAKSQLSSTDNTENTITTTQVDDIKPVEKVQKPVTPQAEPQTIQVNKITQPVANTKPEPPDNHAQQLLKHYEQAVADNNLLQAKGYLNQLKQTDANVEGQAQELKLLIRNKVAAEAYLGELLYSQSQFEQALATWQAVQPLAPDSLDIQSNINRVKRVLKNVKRLEDQQLPVDKPVGDTAASLNAR